MKATMENLILENQRLRQEMLQKGMQLPPIPKGLKHYQMLQYIESSSDSDRKRTFVYTCVLWHNIIRGEMCNFCGAGAPRSRYFFMWSQVGVLVQHRLHLRSNFLVFLSNFFYLFCLFLWYLMGSLSGKNLFLRFCIPLKGQCHEIFDFYIFS